MPEGHTLRRLADELGAVFGGHPVRVGSPQGRFAAEAALLDGTVLERADAAGKHLFLGFAGERVVHVHLGLIGSFRIESGPVPEPVGQVRLRLQRASAESGVPAYADLRGATRCALVTPEQKRSVIARLGPDPLRADADDGRAWRRVSGSDRPIGELLMDQQVLAGVGNVYRAEVLFRHRIHPRRPGRTLRRGQFEAIWRDLVALMADGVRRGRIDTVRHEHLPVVDGRPPSGSCGSAVYVYRRHGEPCRVCGTRVRTEVLAGRNSFWCPRCQPVFRSRART